MTTFLYTHSACFKHDPGRMHPENPSRLKAVLSALDAPEFKDLQHREAPLATREQIARCHPEDYIDEVEATEPKSGHAGIDADTAMSPGSWEAALRAAGALCAAVDAVQAGEADNAFCAVRPPGHHAEPARAMGFCIFNNVAIGALHAREKHGLHRIAVVDFDVHHGNGTQAMFWNDPDLSLFSTHQSPLYPGTGNPQDRGVNNNIHNIPLPPMAGSEEFRRAMSDAVLPQLAKFEPDFLFISAGFDGHEDDPLASLMLHEEDYDWATAQLVHVARGSCGGRVVSTLEGGYNPHALKMSTAAHVRALMQT
ncbi:MAG: histone deacetylase family protein [Rhodovibrionaceae bacterium]|nr:histone deacetylase family protein [Rhodovibrionaceae bacterium]